MPAARWMSRPHTANTAACKLEPCVRLCIKLHLTYLVERILLTLFKKSTLTSVSAYSDHYWHSWLVWLIFTVENLKSWPIIACDSVYHLCVCVCVCVCLCTCVCLCVCQCSRSYKYHKRGPFIRVFPVSSVVVCRVFGAWRWRVDSANHIWGCVCWTDDYVASGNERHSQSQRAGRRGAMPFVDGES